MTMLPMVLIPVYLVPLSIVLHIASLAKLRSGEARAWRAPTPQPSYRATQIRLPHRLDAGAVRLVQIGAVATVAGGWGFDTMKAATSHACCTVSTGSR